MPERVPPTVGPASDEYRAICAYTGLTHDGPACGRRATLHIITTSATYGLVALSTCDDHARTARDAGEFVAEHEHAGLCGLPGTIWNPDLNRCVIDDSGEEPVLVGAGTRGQETGDAR